jgi:hypothetical protein
MVVVAVAAALVAQPFCPSRLPWCEQPHPCTGRTFNSRGVCVFAKGKPGVSKPITGAGMRGVHDWLEERYPIDFTRFMDAVDARVIVKWPWELFYLDEVHQGMTVFVAWHPDCRTVHQRIAHAVLHLFDMAYLHNWRAGTHRTPELWERKAWVGYRIGRECDRAARTARPDRPPAAAPAAAP